MLTWSNFAWAAYASTCVSCSRFEKSGQKSVTNNRFFSRFNDFSCVVKFLKTFCTQKTII